MLFYILAVTVNCLTSLALAHRPDWCGTTPHNAAAEAANPGLARRRQEIEQFSAAALATGIADDGHTIKIDVIVNVVYNSNAQNISGAQIQSQIDVLNDDFNALNTDLSDLSSTEFDAIKGNYNIEFNLFQTRRQWTRKKSFRDESMKSNSDGLACVYCTTKLNLWVANLGRYLGWAYFPSHDGQWDDGVVVTSDAFGSTDDDTDGSFYLMDSYDKGRTATHEIGHWMGLEHIWGPYNCGCGCDDGVSDTPVSGKAWYGCPSYPTSTCGSTDMTMNYMDYTDDACMYAFTAGQVSKGRFAFDCSGNGGRLAYDTNSLCDGGTDPTQMPTDAPTENPTLPTVAPTQYPTDNPIIAPTESPVLPPTANPLSPTEIPTDVPTEIPTFPSQAPTGAPEIVGCCNWNAKKNRKDCKDLSKAECDTLSSICGWDTSNNC